MKSLFFLLITALFFTSCKSSYTKIGDANANYIPYYLKVYEADSLFLTNNYKGSYEILDKLFKKYEPINMEGYYEYGNYLSSALMTGNLKNIRRKVIYSYNKFGDVLLYHDKYFEFKDKLYKESQLSVSERDSLKKKYMTTLQIGLRKEIEKMIIDDQFARTNGSTESMNELGEKHKIQLERIFKEYGYPDFNSLGSDNYFDESAEISLLLLHQDKSFHEKFLPFILENVKKGKTTPLLYAVVYDRYFWNKSNEKGGKEQQYYGSYVNIRTGEINLELSNPTKIDSIRKSIGMPHIQYPLWRYKH